MSFDTYANFQTEVLKKLNRTQDADAVAQCPSWITLAENELRLALNKLKLWQGETLDTNFQITGEYNNLEAGWFGTRKIMLTSSVPRVTLDYATPTQLDNYDQYADAAMPKLYTIQNGQMRVYPPPDATYTASHTYFALQSLSNSNTSNWMLANYPKIYLKAVEAEALDYYGDTEGYQACRADMERLLEAANTSNSVDQMGARQRVRVDNGNP